MSHSLLSFKGCNCWKSCQHKCPDMQEIRPINSRLKLLSLDKTRSEQSPGSAGREAGSSSWGEWLWVG